jgi:hypothetical protein
MHDKRSVHLSELIENRVASTGEGFGPNVYDGDVEPERVVRASVVLWELTAEYSCFVYIYREHCKRLVRLHATIVSLPVRALRSETT